MKLESIIIKNFRSIEIAKLANCGGFHVLIGKNNSGKSNILSAIYAFFSCVQDGKFIVLNPPIGQETDFFRRKDLKDLENNLQIEITQTFSLSSDEIKKLKRNMVRETPKMKTEVDNINSSRLSVTIKVSHFTPHFVLLVN
jgi:putative ATP-dependent endonuclease of OLD family